VKPYVQVSWIITWGGKKERDRERAVFGRRKLALQFFKEKGRDGKHVSVYKETVTKVVEKIA
jgi:hypothetical protein